MPLTLRQLLVIGSCGASAAHPLIPVVSNGAGSGTDNNQVGQAHAVPTAAVLLPQRPTGSPAGSVTPAETAAGKHCHSISVSLATDKWCVSNCALGNCPKEMCSSSCTNSGSTSPSPPPSTPTIWGETDDEATVDVAADGKTTDDKATDDEATATKEVSGNCSWVGNGANGAYCTQWALQSVGECSPQDICRDGSGTTAHYGKNCKSLGFTRGHHTQTLSFGGCGGTPAETAGHVFLYPGPKLEAKTDTYCSWVGSVTSGGAYCSQWLLQTVGQCDGVDICKDGTDVDPPFGVTKAHYGTSCKSLGYTREATFCSRCVGGKSPNTELLNFGGCAGSPDQRGSAVWVSPRPPYNCSGACKELKGHIY